MVWTALGCGLGLLFAAGLFRRELRLWRARDELDGAVFQYTPGRFVRRALGCALLALNMVLVFLALEVIDFTGHLVLLQVWWGVVGLLCVGLVVLPLLDMRETYRHVTTTAESRLRDELARLQPTAPRKPHAASRGKHAPRSKTDK